MKSPSALAAGLTGRTPRYGFHLDAVRRATLRVRVDLVPERLDEWGTLGGVIGRMAGNYWAVPVIEGIERPPRSDQLKHFGAAMASAKMTVWGDPDTVSKMSETFFRGQSFGFFADGLVNAVPDAVKDVAAQLGEAGANLAQRLGGNGADEPDGGQPTDGGPPTNGGKPRR